MTSEVKKRCNHCATEKTLDCFHKSKVNKFGRVSRCKDCYRKSSKGRYQRTRSMEPVSVGYLCPVCQDVGRQSDWHRDHDHETGEARAWLCRPCNLALGGLKDNPDVIAKALRYLAEHGKSLPSGALRDFLRAYPVKPPRRPRRYSTPSHRRQDASLDSRL